VPRAVLVDVDGTLVDTNYHHALTWFRAFRQSGLTVPVWRIHRHIGMGGDQLVRALCGPQVEEEAGDAVRAAEAVLFTDAIDHVVGLPGACELVERLKEDGRRVVLSSSARAEEVERYVDLLGLRGLVDGWTTSADVERTKPEPDLLRAGMEIAGTDDAALVGDSTWDCVAARRAGIPVACVATGGFAAEELREAGAAVVFEDLPELLRRFGETPLG
jgi:phosphoglycolate phosphatase-like HAD superfamily hydrolase